MYTISKKFNFSAGHKLEGLPADHPCSNFHGHNYVVTVELKSEDLNSVGMVFDYRELQPIKKWIDETLDHKNLNYVLFYGETIQPTAEKLAYFCYLYFDQLLPSLYRMGIKISAVTVSETDKTSARYEP